MSEKPEEWDRSRDEIISGEYVLGVLSEQDRRRVEARLKVDPKFAMQVRRWQENLAEFNDADDEIKSISTSFRRLAPQNDNRRDEDHSPSPWSSLLFWRSLAAIAVAGCLAIAAFDRLPYIREVPLSRNLVADLTGLDMPIGLAARYELQTGQLTISPSAITGSQAKSLQVWTLEEGMPPVSMGILPTGGGSFYLTDSARESMEEGKVIAITLEPFGGSKSGRPTGPVVATGKAKLQN